LHASIIYLDTDLGVKMKNNKIAILILAHDNKNQLIKLINQLKPDFDIFVHIDKKAKIKISSDKNVYIFSAYNVYWGSFNLIRVILRLFEESYKIGYERYVLISGRDLPIISNKKIIEYFSNNSNEYLSYEKLPISGLGDNGGFDRVQYYYQNKIRGEINIYCHMGNLISSHIFRLLKKIMKHYGYTRKIQITLYAGGTWINITHSCLEYILNYLAENKYYYKRFKYTRCGDEIFFQTIICNSKYIKLLLMTH